jgi:hypothetical protein
MTRFKRCYNVEQKKALWGMGRILGGMDGGRGGGCCGNKEKNSLLLYKQEFFFFPFQD